MAWPSALLLKPNSTVLYAVWKSTLYSAAHGRLSIAVSEKPAIEDPRDDIVRRGWWDYVPRAPASEADSHSVRPQQQRTSGPAPAHGRTTSSGHMTRPSGDSLVRRIRDSVMRITTSVDLQQQQSSEPLEQPQTFARKSSIPTEYPLPQPPRPRHQQSQVSEKDRIGLGRAERQGTPVTKRRLSDEPLSARATSIRSINFAPQPTSQRSSRIDPLQPGPPRQHDDERVTLASIASKRLPAVLQVRAVIKDEVSIFFSCWMSDVNFTGGVTIF
jgi:hypothetical protein